MRASAQVIERKINMLPDDLKREVLHFIDFLLTRRKTEKAEQAQAKQLDFSAWEGALSEFKDEYTSVELQHQAMQWR
jgi:protein-disulfide isomerase